MIDKITPSTWIADYGVAITLIIIGIIVFSYYIRKRINYLEKVRDDELEEKRADRELRREESQEKLKSEKKLQETTVQFNALLTDAINFQSEKIKINSDTIDINSRKIEENSSRIIEHDDYFKDYSKTVINRFNNLDNQLVELRDTVDKILVTTTDPKTKEELELLKEEIRNHIEKSKG